MRKSRRSNSNYSNQIPVPSEENELLSLQKQDESLDEELEAILKEIEELEDSPENEEQELLDRCKELENENSEIVSRIDEIGDENFLLQQKEALKKMSSQVFTHRGVFLDLSTLQQNGILKRGESLAILPSKVQNMHNELSDLEGKRSTIIEERSTMIKTKRYEDKEEERKLREEKAEAEMERKMRLMSPLKDSGKSARENQLESVRREIFTLKMQLDDIKKAEVERIKNKIDIEEVREVVLSAGGKENDVREVGDSLFMIGKSVFGVKKNRNSLVAVVNNKEQPLNTFIEARYSDPLSSFMN